MDATCTQLSLTEMHFTYKIQSSPPTNPIQIRSLANSWLSGTCIWDPIYYYSASDNCIGLYQQNKCTVNFGSDSHVQFNQDGTGFKLDVNIDVGNGGVNQGGLYYINVIHFGSQVSLKFRIHLINCDFPLKAIYPDTSIYSVIREQIVDFSESISYYMAMCASGFNNIYFTYNSVPGGAVINNPDQANHIYTSNF